nr:hypothetical protein [Tanacetum cinerariifolium]
MLEQTFNRLQAIRNRSDLDTLSLDDLYNHLKVYEPEVQKKSDSQNMAFISLAKNNSGNGEVNTVSIPTASTQVSHASANVAVASISPDTACAYIASQSNGSQINYEDINQIDEDDIKEMDIKECRAPRSQDRGRRENFKQGSKVKESAYKSLMAIDGVGWDWSYMANEKKAHALVADQAAPIEFALMAKCNSDTKVEARLVEFKNQEIKFCEKIRGLEFKVESKTNRIKSLTNKLEMLKKEKEGLDSKLIGLPEFAGDTITDYSRPSPSIETDSPTVIKTNKDETVRKPSVKYAKMYRKTSKSSNAYFNCGGFDHLSYDCGKWVDMGKSRTKNNTHKSMPPRTVFHKSDKTPMKINRPNMNVAQPKMTSFYKPAHSYVSKPFQRKSTVRTQVRVSRVPTVNKKFPTLNRKFLTGNSKVSTADMGNIGKAVKASACWIWKPKQNSTVKDYEPYDGGYVSFGQGGCKITEVQRRHGKNNNEGGRPSEEAPRGNGSQNVNISLLLAAHIERSENGQPLQSSLTSAYGGHALSNNIRGNLPPN